MRIMPFCAASMNAPLIARTAWESTDIGQARLNLLLRIVWPQRRVIAGPECRAKQNGPSFRMTRCASRQAGLVVQQFD
jgi:hypothetical protein